MQCATTLSQIVSQVLASATLAYSYMLGLHFPSWDTLPANNTNFGVYQNVTWLPYLILSVFSLHLFIFPGFIFLCETYHHISLLFEGLVVELKSNKISAINWASYAIWWEVWKRDTWLNVLAVVHNCNPSHLGQWGRGYVVHYKGLKSVPIATTHKRDGSRMKLSEEWI